MRFKRPVRVVPLEEGPPRAFRVIAGNLSRRGMFLQMPQPFAEGTQLALSLEAGGRVLPFAQAEVVWREYGQAPITSGAGVRFTSFLHPRAHELVQYLVEHLDRGLPLPSPKPRRFKRLMLGLMFVVALVVGGSLMAAVLKLVRQASEPELVVPPPEARPVAAELAPAQVGDEVPAAPPQPPPPSLVEAKAPATEPPSTVAEPTVAAAAPAPPEAPPRSAEGSSPVPASAPPAAQMAEPTSAPKPAVADAQGSLSLPKSGVSAVRWSRRAGVLTLELATKPGAVVGNVFLLRGPSRLVIDLTGPAPAKSHLVPVQAVPHVKGMRLGRQAKSGTRLVVDLDQTPAKVEHVGSQVRLHF